MNPGRLLHCIGVAGLGLLLNVPLTSAQLQLVGLTNSIWAYSIDNSDQYALGFPNVDTSHWPKGRALFGNDTSEGGYPYPFVVTVPGSAAGVQSSYYQTSFQWSGGIAAVVLAMTNYVDDGVVIYLNGVEITRWNINAAPGASVDHNTMATAANPGGEPVRVVHRVPFDALTNGIPNPLMPGQNVLAVSLHQAGGGSSDAVFGLSVGTEGEWWLCGFVLPSATNVVQCRNVQFVLTIPPQCQEPDWIQWFHNETLLVGETGHTLTLTNVQPGLDDGEYYARLGSWAGQILTSRASLSVTPDTIGPRIQSVTGVWGADDQWLVTFDEPVELFGGAADSFAYEIRQVGNTDKTLPVIGATLQPNGREVILVTAVSRMLGHLYTYTTLQPIDDACAGNTTAPGMTGLVFLQNAILDYGDFRLWRYSDRATDYGAEWRASAFDDSGWSSGWQLFHRNRANLDATSVAGQAVGTFLELTNYTANPPTNLATVYLRLKLPVPASTVQLTGFPIYDDGFILYVNGVEVYRTNVAAAADQWANYSGGGSVEAGVSFTLPFEIPMSAVTVGAENTIAVMLKQVNGTSGDLTFGLRIVATVCIDDAIAPALTITRSATGGVQLSWPHNPIYSLYQAAAIAGPFTPVANDPQGTYLVADPGLDSNILFQLRLNGR